MEETLGRGLAAALMAPVERLDTAVSNLSAMRDAAKDCTSAATYRDLLAAVKAAVDMMGQLRYRKRDCHSLLRLVNLSGQFTSDVAVDLVCAHRRLIRSIFCCYRLGFLPFC